MKLPLRRLRTIQNARVARVFELEARGYCEHANRVWFAIERLQRAIEDRLARGWEA